MKARWRQLLRISLQYRSHGDWAIPPTRVKRGGEGSGRQDVRMRRLRRQGGQSHPAGQKERQLRQERSEGETWEGAAGGRPVYSPWG